MSQLKAAPSPPGQPILGHMNAFKNDVLNFLHDLAQDYDEIVHLKLAHINMYLLFEPELIRELFVKRASEFEKGEITKHIIQKVFGQGLVASTGDFHRKQRKLMQPVFYHQRIKGYGQVMTDYTERVMADWPTNKVMNMHAEMMQLTMYIVGKTLFNADMDSLADESKIVSDAIAGNQYYLEKEFWVGFKVPSWLPTRGQQMLKENNHRLQNVLRPIIAAHHEDDEKNEGDLLSLLMSAEDENGRKMDDDLLMDEVINLFSAGHETTSNALTWAFYLLAQHPDIMAKLQAELDGVLNGRVPTIDDLDDLPYTEMVIKEAMRIFPPVWSLQFREARADTNIGNYAIKKGSLVTASPYGLHRNPKYFPNPEQFEPERFSLENSKDLPRYAYLPFGAGPHVCIGAQFAMMEAKLILAMVTQRFNMSIAPGEMVEPEALITMAPKNGLNLILEERTPMEVAHQPERIAELAQAEGCPFHS